MKRAFIIGNGPSRAGFNLELLRDHGTIFGCNALYRDFKPDYLVAIDDPIIEEIKKSKFPKKKFIEPPDDEKYEDPGYNKFSRVRSNAGVNALLEAIKLGHDELICLGFDFMVKDPKHALGNVYQGTNAYGPETKSNYTDSVNRVKYMTFLAQKYKNTKFKFVVPTLHNKDEFHNLNAHNVSGMFYSHLNQLLQKEKMKEAMSA